MTIKIFRKIFIAVFVFVAFLFAAEKSYAAAATFSLSPSSGTLLQTCEYYTEIRLNTQSGTTNAADIIITFDPTKIEILDTNPSVSGVQIEEGSVYGSYFGNQANNGTGEIRLTGATFDSNFSGSGVFANIKFSPRSGATSGAFTINFTGADPYNSLDSNIADSATSNDMLTGVTNATYSFTSGSCASDTTPPNITFVTPQNGQTGIPATANVQITLTDAGVGVDITRVEVIINGITYTSDSPEFSYTGNIANYSITIDPAEPLLTNQANGVFVRTYDFAGNVRQESIVFNAAGAGGTGDNEVPVIDFIDPEDGGTLDNGEPITFSVSDDDSGIDITTLQVTLNGVVYNYGDPELTITGNSSLYNITLDYNEDIPLDSASQLTVFISDNDGNALDQSIVFNVPGGLPATGGSCTGSRDLTGCLTNTSNNLLGDVPGIKNINTIVDRIFKEIPILNSDAARKIAEEYALPIMLIPLLLQLILLLSILLDFISKSIKNALLGFLIGQGYFKGSDVWGGVYSSADEKPIKGALVALGNKEGKFFDATLTNEKGEFGFNVPPGEYILRIMKNGWAFPSLNKVALFSGLVTLEIENGQKVYYSGRVRTSRIDFFMDPDYFLKYIDQGPGKKSPLLFFVWHFAKFMFGLGFISAVFTYLSLRLPLYLFVLGVYVIIAIVYVIVEIISKRRINEYLSLLKRVDDKKVS